MGSHLSRVNTLRNVETASANGQVYDEPAPFYESVTSIDVYYNTIAQAPNSVFYTKKSPLKSPNMSFHVNIERPSQPLSQEQWTERLSELQPIATRERDKERLANLISMFKKQHAEPLVPDVLCTLGQVSEAEKLSKSLQMQSSINGPILLITITRCKRTIEHVIRRLNKHVMQECRFSYSKGADGWQGFDKLPKYIQRDLLDAVFAIAILSRSFTTLSAQLRDTLDTRLDTLAESFALSGDTTAFDTMKDLINSTQCIFKRPIEERYAHLASLARLD